MGCDDRNPHRNPSALVYKAVDGRQGCGVTMKSGTVPSHTHTHACAHDAHMCAHRDKPWFYRNPSQALRRPRRRRLAQQGCGAEREHRNPSRVPARTRVKGIPLGVKAVGGRA